MLVLRDAQMRAFERAARRRFLGWLEAHVRESFADRVAGLTPRELRRRLREAVHRAERFGIEDGPDVTRYVHRELRLGAGFADDPRWPWVGELLRRTDVSGGRKVRLLDALLTEEATRRETEA
jgi:hypothetical protein